MSLFDIDSGWTVNESNNETFTGLEQRELRSFKVEDPLLFLNEQKIGRYTLIPTPQFSNKYANIYKQSTHKTLLHLDYTASAQGLGFIENYLGYILETYANTHTETSATGKYSTIRFHAAIESIRKHVGAGKDSFVIPSGYGATGAIEKLQKLLGVYLSPKTQQLIKENLSLNIQTELSKKIVMFVGPFEHHSNDVGWQDSSLCKFVRIKALKSGANENSVDLVHLEEELKKYEGYIKLGSFSAASNVTGMKCDLKSIGNILHKYNALFFVDYAASGPYADIDMSRDNIDAIYLSMHKNLGGANLGLLIGKNRIYDENINPTFGGGGTVSAVTPWEYHFNKDIEDREYPGTPAIRQVWQAALSFQLKDWIGIDRIHNIEKKHSETFINFFENHPKMTVLGNKLPENRYPIFSFLIHHGNKTLHHTLCAAILNDLFGIQARSGCACAGPFGHELLNIPKELSDKFVDVILQVLNGYKPGWTRIAAHYTASDEEINYTLFALSLTAWFGPLIIGDYNFDPYDGSWKHLRQNDVAVDLSIHEALNTNYDSTSMFKVKNEASLNELFEKQKTEALTVVSLKFAEALYIDPSDVFEFSNKLLPTLSKVVARNLSQDVVEQMLKDDLMNFSDKYMVQAVIDTLFYPEKASSLWHKINTLDPEIQFFYVAKNRMQNSLQLNKMSKPTQCKPCVS